MAYELTLRIVSGIGFLISFYFVARHKEWIKSDKWVPSFICADNACIKLISTKFAHLFNIPNFTWGLLYYAVVFVATFFDISSLLILFSVISWLVVLYSLYLAYALLFRLKTICRLCFASHILNIIIAVVYTVSVLN